MNLGIQNFIKDLIRVAEPSTKRLDKRETSLGRKIS